MASPRRLIFLLLMEKYIKISEKIKNKLGKIQKWLHLLLDRYQIIHKISFKSSPCIFQIHGSASKNYTYESNKKISIKIPSNHRIRVAFSEKRK